MKICKDFLQRFALISILTLLSKLDEGERNHAANNDSAKRFSSTFTSDLETCFKVTTQTIYEHLERGRENIFEQVISDGLTDHKSTWQHFSRTLTISQDVIQITGIEIKIAPVCHHICKSTTVHQSSELIIFNPLY